MMRMEFRKDLGITEPGLDRMIRMSYALTGLISFFTVGPDECRAWNVHEGRDCAGGGGQDPHRPGTRVHPRGGCALGRPARRRFDGRSKEARAGAARGEEYVVQDGDCLNILFNV